MGSEVSEAIGDLESFRSECRKILGEPSLSPRERLYALYARGVERETALRQKGVPGPLDTSLNQIRGTLPANPDLKAGLICGVFLTALEASREQVLPGALTQVVSIVRIALGWGRFSTPTIGGDVDLAAVSRATVDWGAPDAQSLLAAYLEEWLKEPERFARLGMIRGMGALVVGSVLMGWYARALAVRDGQTISGKNHLERSAEISRGLVSGGAGAPMEKLMQTGLFSVFFDSLLGRPPVVAALAALF